MKNRASAPCIRLNKPIRSSLVTKKRMGVLIRPVLASRVIRGYTIRQPIDAFGNKVRGTFASPKSAHFRRATHLDRYFR